MTEPFEMALGVARWAGGLKGERVRRPVVCEVVGDAPLLSM